MGQVISSYRELNVYRDAMGGAMEIFELTGRFPGVEKYSLVDQIRRSSRSVCANIAEAWRKRRYPAAFVAKLNDAESEANETQVWIDFIERCAYLDVDKCYELQNRYDRILGQLVCMGKMPEK